MIDGRVLYVDVDQMWLTKNRKLFLSRDFGKTWFDFGVLPIRKLRQALSINRYGCRLGRLGIHHLNFINKDKGIVIGNKDIYCLDLQKQTLSWNASLYGSRPLSLCVSNEKAYYGEYAGNIERKPVRVLCSDLSGNWVEVFRFENIRHIHGVFFDKYSNSFWVTTGDNDNEYGIWNTLDNFDTLNKVAGGNQMHRAVDLLFTKDFVYYGSDAPDQKNYIYRIVRENGKIERLTEVNSSVFYGCKVGESLFFSTAVEPSSVNKTKYAEVWRSDNGKDWYKFFRVKKDFLSMKYFQYGQILFPSGPGDEEHVYFTPYSTKFHEKTFCINLKKSEGFFYKF